MSFWSTLRREFGLCSNCGVRAFVAFIVIALGSGALTSSHAGWSQIITFDEFEEGVFRDPADPVAQLVRVTRDEGFEAGRTEGFATHHISNNGAGGRMYSLGTAGHGYSWGHVFAAIELDTPITDRATMYMQLAMTGTDHDYNVSLSHMQVTPRDPPLDSNPWGWEGPRAWGDKRTTIRNHWGMIGIRDGGNLTHGEHAWLPGVWYEIWLAVNVPEETYTVYLRSPAAGIDEQQPLVIQFDGDDLDYYYFRATADVLQTVLIATIAGDSTNPLAGHPVFLNALAFDFQGHNLTDPPVPPPPHQLPWIAPAIEGHPQSLMLGAGERAEFSVAASGTDLIYQWRKDDSDIPGATGSTLVIDEAVPGDSGGYTVVVSNEVGSAESQQATLTVDTEEPFVLISPESRTFDYPDKTYQITLTSNTTWSVEGSPGWANISPRNGMGSAQLTVHVTGNTSTESRSGEILISGKLHTITQSGAPHPSERWTQIITFDGFEVGAYRDPTDPIAQLVRVTRDEGFEAGRTEGFATHHIHDNDAEGRMYHLSTAGHGYSWGHVFAAIELDTPITDRATMYMQIAMAGTDNDYSVSLSHMGVDPRDPPLETNPWGWESPRSWGDQRAIIRNHSGMIGIRDGGDFRYGEYPWVPGAWYELWMTVNVPEETYTIYLRSPAAGIDEQRPIVVQAWGSDFDSYFFRAPADVLQSVMIAMVAGNPMNPFAGDPVFLNALAVDFEGHNLSDPPVPPPPHQLTWKVPLIVSPPQPMIVHAGDRVEFSVVAYGGDLSYQWRKDGSDIMGATSAVLVINEATTGDAGQYTVTVSNENGSAESKPVTLSVTPEAPFLSLSPESSTIAYSKTSYEVTLLSNIAWEVETAPAWASVSPLSGTGDAILTIAATANFDTEPRMGAISISGTSRAIPSAVHTTTQSGASPPSERWSQIITFDEFEVGTYRDPADAIAQLVRVTRDEGYEGGRTEGFATHHIHDNGAGGRMYQLSTAGHGYSWGHVFAAIDLDFPITRQATMYQQLAMAGTGNDYSLALSHIDVTPHDPPLVSNPWGWEGPHRWEHMRTTIRNHWGMIGIRDGGNFTHGEHAWLPGVWYEIWMTVDVPRELYTVHLRAPSAGFEEQEPVVILFEGVEFEEYFLRGRADVLQSVLIGMVAGSPMNPVAGHAVYINAMAFDFGTHNLGDPPVPPSPLYLWPSITAHPQPLVLKPGETAAFSVEAAGPELAYQWRKDGADIPGATGPALAIEDLTTNNAGEYTVLVSNPYGESESRITTLVVQPPFVSISPAAMNVASDGLTYEIAVQANTPWNVGALPDWVHASLTAGEGDGAIEVRLDANDSPAPRAAVITIGDQELTVLQAAFIPEFSLLPESAVLSAHAGSLTVTLNADSSTAPWTIGARPGWLTLLTPSSGSGNTTVEFAIAANHSVLARSTEVMIAGETLTLSQAGMTPAFSFSPTTIEIDFRGGAFAVELTASPPDAPWQIAGVPGWIGAYTSTGVGSATLVFTVTTNSSPSDRSAVLTIEEATLTVVQRGMPQQSIFEGSEHSLDLGGGWRSNALGYWYDGFFPYVYSYQIGDWLYILGDNEEEFYFWAFTGAYWAYTGVPLYPYFMILTGDQAGQWIKP